MRMIKYFLGSSAPGGFFSLFDELTPTPQGYIFILKGGPGTGKSTLMKNVAAAAEAAGIACERICCSSDPASLDGVILPSINMQLADGTTPHTLEPKYPGALGEIVNLGEFWNSDSLADSREEIIRLTDMNAACHARCKRFLDAAFSLHSCAVRLLQPCVDGERLRRYASRCASRSFPRPSGKIGSEKKRLLEAITPDGYIFLTETAEAMCDSAFIFEEDFACASLLVVDELRQYALGNGLDVITSPCFTGEALPRHLIIPSLSLGFFTSDCFCSVTLKNAKTAAARRFYEPNTLSRYRVRLNFSKKACGEMLAEAVSALTEAKEIHDRLETPYINSMDFDRLKNCEKALIEKIVSQKGIICP